jgi:hypothetical protein
LAELDRVAHFRDRSRIDLVADSEHRPGGDEAHESASTTEGGDPVNVPDGIQEMIRTVVENAYLRAVLAPTKKQVMELSGDERSGALEPFEKSIHLDVELLRSSFVQFAATAAANQVSERLNDVELKPVVFDTAERESEDELRESD